MSSRSRCPRLCSWQWQRKRLAREGARAAALARPSGCPGSKRHSLSRCRRRGCHDCGALRAWPVHSAGSAPIIAYTVTRTGDAVYTLCTHCMAANLMSGRCSICMIICSLGYILGAAMVLEIDHNCRLDCRNLEIELLRVDDGISIAAVRASRVALRIDAATVIALAVACGVHEAQGGPDAPHGPNC